MEKIENGAKVKKRADFWIIFTTAILLCVGLVMVSSASSYAAIAQYGKQDVFLKQQLIATVIGGILMWIAANFKYEYIKKLSYVVFVVAYISMWLVFLPGIGHSSKGATRWLNTPIGTIQPSELLKVGLILALSYYLSENFKKVDNKIKGLIPAILMFIVSCVALYFQNHMSAMLVMAVITCSIIIASGVRIKKRYIALFIIIAVAAGTIFLVSGNFRLARIISHFSPDGDSSDGEWQADQSLLAIGSGKVFGRGIGQSRQKYLWLPEAQTDFIFSVLAEELGFVGCAFVLLAYAIMLIRGFVVAIYAKDLFATLVSTGIVCMLAFQVMINIAVVTAIIPVTGMPLPLLSHGGTALIINLGVIGLLLNMSKQAE